MFSNLSHRRKFYLFSFFFTIQSTAKASKMLHLMPSFVSEMSPSEVLFFLGICPDPPGSRKWVGEWSVDLRETWKYSQCFWSFSCASDDFGRIRCPSIERSRVSDNKIMSQHLQRPPELGAAISQSWIIPDPESWFFMIFHVISFEKGGN